MKISMVKPIEFLNYELAVSGVEMMILNRTKVWNLFRGYAKVI